jgi:hypothetical protein
MKKLGGCRSKEVFLRDKRSVTLISYSFHFSICPVCSRFEGQKVFGLLSGGNHAAESRRVSGHEHRTESPRRYHRHFALTAAPSNVLQSLTTVEILDHSCNLRNDLATELLECDSTVSLE